MLRVWAETAPQAQRKTAAFITQDIGEAVFLADRMVVMSSPDRIVALVHCAAQESLDRAQRMGHADCDTAALTKTHEDKLGIQVRQTAAKPAA